MLWKADTQRLSYQDAEVAVDKDTSDVQDVDRTVAYDVPEASLQRIVQIISANPWVSALQQSFPFHVVQPDVFF